MAGGEAVRAAGPAQPRPGRRSLRDSPTEMRIGLVLYGGVSLAVYMSGVVQEFLDLVRAGRSDNPAELEANGYWELLAELGATAAVDVVAGASAGGINGVMLCQALARGGDLAALGELWRRRGDLYYLLDQGARDGRAESLLNGDWFAAELERAMAGQAAASAAPLADALDLYISATDLHGRYWQRRDYLRHEIAGRQHLHLFHLRYRRPLGLDGPEVDPACRGSLGYHQDDFADPARLARIARATASFPVAFEPVDMDAADVYSPDPAYRVDPRRKVWLADGGYLMNRPFAPVLRTIFHRAAYRPVDRLLFYVEPAPERGVPARDRLEAKPNALATALKAVELPMYQSIDGHLREIEEHNRRVQQVRALQDCLAAAGPAPGGPDPAPGGPDPAPGDPDPAHPLDLAYQQLRLGHLARELADGLRQAVVHYHGRAPGGPPAQERINGHVRAALAALDAYLDLDGAPAPDPEEFRRREALLDRLDIAYHVRRIHYLIDEFGRRYYRAPGLAPALVRELGHLEWGLWQVRERVRQVQWEWWHPEEAASATGRLGLQPLARRHLEGLLAALAGLPGDPPGPAGRPADPGVQAARRAAIHPLLWDLGQAVQAAVGELEPVLAAADARLAEEPRALGPGRQLRLGLLDREFRRRDLLLFPMTAFGTLGERDEVEWVRISPYDADSLVKAGMPWEPLQASEAGRLWPLGDRKVAGDELGNFAGFLSARWRTNDHLWGRLDGADLIISTLVRRAEQLAAGEGAGADVRYRGADLDRVRIISHRVRQRIFKEALRSLPAADRYPELAERVRDAVAERRAANRPGAPLAQWLHLNADILDHQTVQELMDLAQQIYQLDVAGAEDALGRPLRQYVEQAIAAAGFNPVNPPPLRPAAGRGQRTGPAVPAAWIHLLTWRQLQQYLCHDHTTGSETVRDLDAGVVIHTATELAENARQTLLNLLPERVRSRLPAPLRWAGEVITALRGVVRAFVPRPAPEQEGAGPPPAYARVAAVAAALSALVTYLAARGDTLVSALAGAGWAVAGAVAFAWLIWPGRWLLRLFQHAPAPAGGAFWLGLWLLAMVGLGRWLGSGTAGVAIPLTGWTVTPAGLSRGLLATGAGLLALWLLAGLAGALGRPLERWRRRAAAALAARRAPVPAAGEAEAGGPAAPGAAPGEAPPPAGRRAG